MFIFIIKSEKQAVCVNIVYLICLILLLIFLQDYKILHFLFTNFASIIANFGCCYAHIFFAMPPGTNLVVMLILAN